MKLSQWQLKRMQSSGIGPLHKTLDRKISSDDEDDTTGSKPEPSEIQTRSKAADSGKGHKSKWERFPAVFADAARYQSQRLYHYLDRALDGPGAVNLHSQFASVPDGDGIGVWIALLGWSDSTTDPVRAREEALDAYYKIPVKMHMYEAYLCVVGTPIKVYACRVCVIHYESIFVASSKYLCSTS